LQDRKSRGQLEFAIVSIDNEIMVVTACEYQLFVRIVNAKAN